MTATHIEPPINQKELAEQMKVSPGYVSAMKKAGYKMKYGHQTTLEHAMEWRAEHPDFTVSSVYLRKGRG